MILQVDGFHHITIRKNIPHIEYKNEIWEHENHCKKCGHQEIHYKNHGFKFRKIIPCIKCYIRSMLQILMANKKEYVSFSLIYTQ